MKSFAISLLLVLYGVANLQAQTPFYEGKTIRIVVGLPAGDVYDLYARMLAEHMGKHIPGSPNIIVQNMAGASSTTGSKVRLAQVHLVGELREVKQLAVYAQRYAIQNDS
jgi:tripartite-type tricarboxylate transporter receptor subunit TctC